MEGMRSSEGSTDYSSSEFLRPRLRRMGTDMPIVVPSSCGGEDIEYRIVKNQIPIDLREDLQRPLAETDRHSLFQSIDMVSADHIPHGQRPKALWIFGPPAVGKSTMVDEIASSLFGRKGNAVLIDGDAIRLAHRGFQKIVEHGCSNHIVHADAWPILKKSKVIDEQKHEICKMAIGNRQNVRIPDAAISIGRITEMLCLFEEAGYEMHAICLWAPMSDTQVRGRARSVETGKVFSTRPYRASCETSLQLGRLWESKMSEGSVHYMSVRFYDSTVQPCRPVILAEFELLTCMTDDDATSHSEQCKAAQNAAIGASQTHAHSALLISRRGKTPIDLSGFKYDSNLFNVSTGHATQRLDELSPLAGSVGRALKKKKIKRIREWDLNGHAKVAVAEIPNERFAPNRRTAARVLLDPLPPPNRTTSSCPNVPRVGFHRLVYQRARHLRQEHGNSYSGVHEVGRDMVRSVKVCMRTTDVGRNLKKVVYPARDEWQNDVTGLLNGANHEKIPPMHDSLERILRQEDAAEVTCAADAWIELLADLGSNLVFEF
mmetsp:Transcript_56470/g.89483  ORF Transcript_56470/g.89483 Transcript_56470/m.89483 type:complete len:546 (+) Transcript_56470:75-1712(+)